ncbi:MAG: sulfotransferase domain-containing protein [Pseudomonadota bacterium]
MTSPVLPTFIIIGAMKCGTTSLHSYLDRHPDTSMSDPKEVDFFSGSNSDKSVEWYASLFDPDKPVRGEASQDYSKGHHPLYKGAPERMKALIPDVKLIYLVRDPIERYFSHIGENYYVGSRADQRWSNAHDNYIWTGLYYYQLSIFL